ncbi:MAG: hypothetical protein AMXMBFR47_33620 [Planctomycetota bacterium]
MHPLRTSLIAAVALAASASATVTTTVDLVDPSDGITPPPTGVIAIDVIVDVSPDDTWTAGGIRAFVTSEGDAVGVRLLYAPGDDPNTPQADYLLNPGIEHRFVTFLTKPRNRDASGRFANGGAAVAGRYVGGAIETATPTELNVAWFSSPPESSSSPSVDGAVARLALDVSLLLGSQPDVVFVVGRPSEATGPIVFHSEHGGGQDLGTVSASYDDHRITGLDWAVWYVPEPGTGFLLFGATALLGRFFRCTR